MPYIVTSPVTSNAPLIAALPVYGNGSSLNDEVGTAVATQFSLPIQAYPGWILGISLLLPIADTNISPEFCCLLATLPTFCIRALPVGFTFVRPPPTWT